MITLKFGGTSMANARRILASSEIIISRAKEDRLSVVVSAAAGVSNTLQSAIEACTGGIAGYAGQSRYPEGPCPGCQNGRQYQLGSDRQGMPRRVRCRTCQHDQRSGAAGSEGRQGQSEPAGPRGKHRGRHGRLQEEKQGTYEQGKADRRLS